MVHFGECVDTVYLKQKLYNLIFGCGTHTHSKPAGSSEHLLFPFLSRFALFQFPASHRTSSRAVPFLRCKYIRSKKIRVLATNAPANMQISLQGTSAHGGRNKEAGILCHAFQIPSRHALFDIAFSSFHDSCPSAQIAPIFHSFSMHNHSSPAF